jgi:hypothetical protein
MLRHASEPLIATLSALLTSDARPIRFSFARSGAARVDDPLRLARDFENVHPDDQSILEAIAVANPGVRDELSGARIVDQLMDLDRDAAVGLLGEAIRLNLARDGGELPAPIVAHRRLADDPTALPGVGPIDLRVHQLDRRLDVAGVKCAVGGS